MLQPVFVFSLVHYNDISFFFLLLVAQRPQYNGVLVCTLCSIFTQLCFDLLYSAKELVVDVINVCNHISCFA